jgi:hypothetical protein
MGEAVKHCLHLIGPSVDFTWVATAQVISAAVLSPMTGRLRYEADFKCPLTLSNRRIATFLDAGISFWWEM